MKGDDWRFFVVEDRKGSTLMELITENVEEGSHIVTDEWRGYSRSTERGYTHHTVNHSRNYVDPESGYHTQNVERAWQDRPNGSEICSKSQM